jgi:hypothetical protein
MTLQLVAVAGIAVLQLVEGRAAGSERRASEVIAPHELDFAVALNSTLEGKTDKQKNPHQEPSLAWTVARLGGWSRYQRYRPADPKTIAYECNQFKTMTKYGTSDKMCESTSPKGGGRVRRLNEASAEASRSWVRGNFAKPKSDVR